MSSIAHLRLLRKEYIGETGILLDDNDAFKASR